MMTAFARIIKPSGAKNQTGTTSRWDYMAVSFQQILKCLLKSNKLLSGLEPQSSSACLVCSLPQVWAANVIIKRAAAPLATESFIGFFFFFYSFSAHKYPRVVKYANTVGDFDAHTHSPFQTYRPGHGLFFHLAHFWWPTPSPVLPECCCSRRCLSLPPLFAFFFVDTKET